MRRREVPTITHVAQPVCPKPLPAVFLPPLTGAVGRAGAHPSVQTASVSGESWGPAWTHLLSRAERSISGEPTGHQGFHRSGYDTKSPARSLQRRGGKGLGPEEQGQNWGR